MEERSMVLPNGKTNHPAEASEATMEKAGVEEAVLGDSEELVQVAEIIKDGAIQAAEGVAEVVLDHAVSSATAGAKSLLGKIKSKFSKQSADEVEEEKND